MAEPQDSGYRAIHVHTRYHGRRIEVQLRTRDQDSWAKIVEDLTSKTGIDFKNGDGPVEVHDLLRELSRAPVVARARPAICRGAQGHPQPTGYDRGVRFNADAS